LAQAQQVEDSMPCAFVIGCAPVAFFTGPMKLAIDLDEMAVAGGSPALLFAWQNASPSISMCRRMPKSSSRG